MENRTLQYYLQSLMPQELLPEEAENQIHTYFSDDEIAEYESRLPKLDYWYKGIQGLLPGQDSINPDAMKNTNMVFASEEKDHVNQKMFPLTKMAPARESTLTTAEEIFKQTAHSSNVFAHTCLCHSRKEIDITSRNIAACYTIVMDLDFLPRMNELDENGNYLLSTEKAAEYLLLYPMFCRFFKMFPPSTIVRTGKKGAQVYFFFNKNVWNEKRRFEYLHQAFVHLFHADPAVGSLFSIVRVPYSSRVNSDPDVPVGQPEIVYQTDKIYDFDFFCDAIKDVVRHTVIFKDLKHMEYRYTSEFDREYVEQRWDADKKTWNPDGSMILSAYLDTIGYSLHSDPDDDPDDDPDHTPGKNHNDNSDDHSDSGSPSGHSLTERGGTNSATASSNKQAHAPQTNRKKSGQKKTNQKKTKTRNTCPAVYGDTRVTDEMIALSHTLFDDAPKAHRRREKGNTGAKTSGTRSAVEKDKMKTFHKNRDHDIKTLVALRNFDVTGHRDLLLYNYATNLSFMNIGKEDITQKTKELNRSFTAPLRERQVDTILRYILRNRGQVKVKSDFDLFCLLDMVEEELSHMYNTYTPEAKAQHRKEMLARRNQEARKARAGEKIRRSARQISMIFRTIKETGSVREACEKTGMAKSSVYRLLKSMGETVKDGKKTSALLEYLKEMIDKAIRNQAFLELFALHIPKQDNLFFYDFPQYAADCDRLCTQAVPA